jgi:hypothetical protein
MDPISASHDDHNRDTTNAPTSTTRFDQLNDDETLILGRFLLAFNALDTAIEDAIMRYWNVTDPRFRAVFFYRMATGGTLRILRTSPFHEDSFGPDCKTIDDIIILRNAIAHSSPRVFQQVVAKSAGATTEEKFPPAIDLRTFGVIANVKGKMMMLADLEGHTGEIMQIVERLNGLRNRRKVEADEDPIFQFLLGPKDPLGKSSDS